MNTQHPDNLNLAMIGNCAFSALINEKGRIVWSCMPHFNGDPVFPRLVNPPSAPEQPEEGFWEFVLADQTGSDQRYIENTAVVETILYDSHGGAVKITDLAPRFTHYERYYKPTTICRIVEPLQGRPRMAVRLRPRFDYGGTSPQITRGGNHMRFVAGDRAYRLTTDMPIIYVEEERHFIVNGTYTFVFGPDEPLTAGIASTGQRFRRETVNYWKEFSRGLAIPFEYQDAIIRAAITLKLCTFEESGAVLAAVTTSIPESPDSGRNWDYRYCWIRDSLFVINALNRLGTTGAMEDYLCFIMNTALQAGDRDLQPLYGIDLDSEIHEWEAPHLNGYRGMNPVRVGNAAYHQNQHDVWGCAVLALTQSFFDKRLRRPGTLEDFQQLEKFGESAARKWNEPDAGIWEFRTFGRVHTFSAVMCWVACDRLAKIAGQIGQNERQTYWRGLADTMHAEILKRAWSDDKQSFVEPLDGEELDASLLLLHEVGFIDAKDPKFVKTLKRVENELMQNGLLYRYLDDDFGRPEVAFTCCTFWYIDALAASGQGEKARAHFEWMLSLRNHVGLLSEDIDFETHELWGNFPQTYSMVGLINSAMRLSKSWHQAI